MKFLLDNVFLVIIAVIIIAVLVQFSIKSYFAEKRKHLSSMMRGDVDVTDFTPNENWKDKLKEK